MDIKNMTAQAILLIRELLASTMELRPWIDVFWQNSFRTPCTMMTPKKENVNVVNSMKWNVLERKTKLVIYKSYSYCMIEKNNKEVWII